jgi:hypothetical protein
MKTRVPTWAVVSPAPEAAVRRAAEEAGASEDFEPWEVRGGSSGYSAILEYEPGTEDSGEAELAASLSRAHPGKHYVLHFHEDAPWVAVFERGSRRKVLRESPFAVAARLGVPVADPAEPAAPDPQSDPRNALVVEERTPEAVASALDVPAEVKRSLRFQGVPRGTLVQAEGPDPRLGGWAYDLSRALDARVYACDWFPKWGEFLCDVIERGKRVARYASPPGDKPGPNSVAAILGESVPEGILRALGIGWTLTRPR